MQSVYNRQCTKLYDNWPHGGAIIQCFPNPVPGGTPTVHILDVSLIWPLYFWSWSLMSWWVDVGVFDWEELVWGNTAIINKLAFLLMS